jgi:hypothetical protein
MLSEIIERKEIRMHKIIVWVLTFAFLLPRVAVAGDTVSVRNAIEVATTSVVVPSVANVTGLTGSVFKTRISLLNPTAFTYPIEATFYDVSGNMSKVNITMAANQMRVYDNFLGDVFGTTGAGSVRFESRQITGGSPNFQFVVNAEVWTIVSSGRYGTSVTTLIGSASTSDSYSAGIRVDSDFRSNVGCFNDSANSNTVVADVFDGSNNLVTTVTLAVPPNAWSQTAIPASVSSGYVRFRPSQPAYCFAVVVNNTTNDGQFIPATEFTP